MLSQIERGVANPTLSVTHAIAQAFGLSLGELVDEPGAAPAVHIVKNTDAGSILRDGGCKIRALTPLRYEGDLELYEVVLQAGHELRSDPHASGTREVVAVQQGRVTVEVGSGSYTLNRHDSITYRADLPHAITNPGSKAAVVLLVDAYT